MIRVFGNHIAQTPFGQKLFTFFTQMQNDVCTTRLFIDSFNRVLALTF
ncbi:Uncharacterised protein [Vibrio cholerae]|nr:Uncharacterised protein [Vibrio cholerae]